MKETNTGPAGYADRSDKLLTLLARPDISDSRDEHTGERWVWAGPAHEESDATDACDALVAVGVLADRQAEDGFVVFRVVTSGDRVAAQARKNDR